MSVAAAAGSVDAITPALADHVRREAEQMKAANLIRALPDWDKVLRPDLLAAARAG